MNNSQGRAHVLGHCEGINIIAQSFGTENIKTKVLPEGKQWSFQNKIQWKWPFLVLVWIIPFACLVKVYERWGLSPARSLCWRSWGQCAWCPEDTGRCWRLCCTTRGLLQREPVFRYVDTHLHSWNIHTSVPFLEHLKLSTILSISRRPIYIGGIIVAYILMLMFEDEMNWHFGSFSCIGDMMRVSMTACPPNVAQRCVWLTVFTSGQSEEINRLQMLQGKIPPDRGEEIYKTIKIKVPLNIDKNTVILQLN